MIFGLEWPLILELLLLGCFTGFLAGLLGIGGGMLRDVLVTEIPTVLRADIYASAALAGATVVAS